MAIQFSVKPKLIAPTGLSLVNPITAIAQKLPSDTDKTATLVIYDQNDNLFCVLKSSFFVDAGGNHIATFEISRVLRSIYPKMKDRYSAVAPPYAQALYLSPFYPISYFDTSYNFSKYYLEIAGDKQHFFAVDAGLESYNIYYVYAPDLIRNYQSDFFDYTIFPDDIDIPIIFGVDFDETDFDETDFN
jgi:hypothetical protein